MSEIIGYGGKGGDGGSTSNETTDNLLSISYAKVLDLVSEGEVQGLVNGLRSVYFDQTPLQNADGSFNFQNVTVDIRTGTQHQDAIAGFSSVENEITIGTELRADTPWVHAISNTQLSAVRVRLAVTALSKVDKENGNINGHRVDYKIELATDDGAYREILSQAFEGKTTSRYERSHRLELPSAKTGWILRVIRTTPNANSATTADVTLVSTITEVIDVRLRYPMSAIVGIQIDASQFRGIPTRSYDMLGRIISVPSNYNPANRSYNGIWDGTFKPAWTDNPAWVFYDLVLNNRYGLGNRLDASSIDKWSLYQIGRYCDVLVPDGQGGTEPRFTCNLYLQAAADAYKVLQDLASICRGISYWAGGSIITSSDMPADPTYIYTAANVIDGKFTGVGSSQKARFTVALVSWNDPSDFYKAKVEYVQDDDGIARYGVQKISMTAFGCTSQGQAQRAGNWALLTSRLETDSLTFSVGLDGLVSSPGQLVRIADPHRMGRRNAGRIRLAVGRTVTLDKAPVIVVGDKLTVMLPTAISETRTVIAIDGDTVTVNVDWSELPAPQAIWSVDNINLVAPIYKIISITEQGGLTYEITALQHEQGKFGYIDNGTRIERPPRTGLDAAPNPPTNLLFSTHPYWVDDVVSSMDATLSWTGFSPVYRVKWRKAFGAWSETKTRTSTWDIKSVETGDYEFAVSAISSTGLESAAATLPVKVTPTLPPLDDITGLRLESSFTSGVAKVAWDKVKGATSYRVQVVAGNPAIVVRTVDVGNTPRFEYTVSDMKADGGTWRTVEFRVKALGKFGTGSATASLFVENKQIGTLVSLRVDQGIRSGYFQCTPPAEEDFAGILIWISKEESCPPVPENIIYDGASCFVTLTHFTDGSELSKESEYYLRAAGYDHFGKDDLNVSPSIPLNVAGVLPDVDVILDSWLSKQLSERIDLIDGTGEGSVASRIAAEAHDRVTEDTKLTSQLGTLAVEVDNNKTAITTEQTVRADENKAIGLRIDSVSAVTGDNAAAIKREEAARTDADSALASRVDNISATLHIRPNLLPNGGFENGISGWHGMPEGMAYTNSVWGDSVVGQGISGTATIYSDLFLIQGGEHYTITGDSLLFNSTGSVYFDMLFYDADGEIVLDGSGGAISTIHDFSVNNENRILHATEDIAPVNATHVRARFVWVDVVDAIVGCRQIKVERGGLPATPYSAEGALSSSFAAIQTETNARITALDAMAETVTTVQTQLDGNVASVQAHAKSIDGLSAQYTVKTDVNGHVAGYGLATTVVDGVPQSDFTILADRFAVVQPGVEKRVPFVVTSKNDVPQIGIDGNLLVNGSVTADALTANSITSDKIKAGSLSANMFSSGIGSGNLCTNGAFIDQYTDALSLIQLTGVIINDAIGGVRTGTNIAGATWTPVATSCYGQHTPNALHAGMDYWTRYMESIFPLIPVVAGQWYEFSVYNGSHRCTSILLVYYYNAAGTHIDTSYSVNNNQAEKLGGTSLTDYKRLFGVTQAPKEAVTARLSLRKGPTYIGNVDSVALWVRAYFGVATGEHQTQPTDWSAPGMGTQISGGAITTRSIAADKISVNQLSAISANLGYVNAGSININNRFIVGADGTTTIQSAPNGQRTVIYNGQILVYDANNVLRVRMGVW